MTSGPRAIAWTRCRKMSLRGHGAFVGATGNEMPPPPDC